MMYPVNTNQNEKIDFSASHIESSNSKNKEIQEEPQQKGEKPSDLPSFAVRSSQDNLKRFHAVQKRTDSLSSPVDAEKMSDQGAAKNSEQLLERDQSRVGLSEHQDLISAQSSITQLRNRHERGANSRSQPQQELHIRHQQGGHANSPLKNILDFLKPVLFLWLLSGSYRLLRNPRDFVKQPLHATVGSMTFSERVGDNILGRGRNTVLERYQKYIPSNAYCNQADAQVSFGLPPVGMAGWYDPPKNQLRLAPYHVLAGGLYASTHEFVHCYTHPEFYNALESIGYRREMLESLTDYLTSKAKPKKWWSSFWGVGSDYAHTTMSNGKKMPLAAAELEKAVSEATLLRAYFGGDKHAIRKVSRAAVDIYPHKVSRAAWSAIKEVTASESKENVQRIAECFVAAALLAENKLPVESNVGGAREYLPIWRFSVINSAEIRELKRQGAETRARLGPAFDQAFYNFDQRAAARALQNVYKEIQQHWKMVL